MKSFLKLTVIACALQPLATFAAPVTLQGTWSCYPGNSCAFAGSGVLEFTYDDSTAGVVVGGPYPQATYTDAITAATIVFDNFAGNFDATGGSSITVRQGRTSGEYDASIQFYVTDANSNRYRFWSSFTDFSQTNGGVELSWLAGLLSDEHATYLLPEGTSPNGPGGVPYALYQNTALAEVPVPAAAWLFGSAMLGLGLSRRKKA